MSPANLHNRPTAPAPEKMASTAGYFLPAPAGHSMITGLPQEGVSIPP